MSSSQNNVDFSETGCNKRKRDSDDEMGGDNASVTKSPVETFEGDVSSNEDGKEGSKPSASIAATTVTTINAGKFHPLQPLLEADGVLVTILAFLPTAKVCRLRSVNKRWKRLGEIAVQNQTKKSFETNYELRQAVLSYCETNGDGDPDPDTSAKYRVKCIYGRLIGDWDVSKITDFSRIFDHMILFNEPIEGWNVSNATIMREMFQYAIKFNQRLSGWNTSNVTDTSRMFFLRRAIQSELERMGHFQCREYARHVSVRISLQQGLERMGHLQCKNHEKHV